MKRKLNKILLGGLAAAFLVLLLRPLAFAANTATLSLTSASYTVTNGSTLTVNVYENSGSDTVNAVQANFSYPTASLTYQSITSSSAFDIAAQSSGGSGSVKIGRGASAAVSGSQLVATVYFTVTGTSGNFSLSLDQSASKVVRSTDNGSESLTYQDASYTISTPAPPPSGGGGSSGGGGTKGSGGSSGSGGSASSSTKSSTSSSSSPSTPLTISQISVDNLSATSATVHWTTNLPASSEVDYGQTTIYGFTTVDSTLTTTHAVVLNSKNLSPHLYHFIVKSTDASGQQAVGKDMTFDNSSGSLSFTNASAGPATKSNTSKTVAIIAIGAIAVLAVGAAVAIRKMHHRALQNQELDSHIFKGPTSPTPPPAGGAVITPESKPPNEGQ